MMREASPWDDIAIPNANLNVRQLSGNMAVPCFWGRDTNGACLFLLELQGDHAVGYRKNTTTVSGIHVDLRAGYSGQQHLVLTLEEEANRDLFQGLCQTLGAALVHASDSASSLTIALAHIRRWKIFFSGRGAQHLSPQEVRGLFAELTFLIELLSRSSSSSFAITAWLGLEKSHQDFIFGNTAVEVKSLSGAERNAVRISSEDQLESLNDALFLRIYRLSNLVDAMGAQSLNEIVSTLQASLVGDDSLDAFDRKLSKYGYAPLPEYDEPRFVITEVRTFRVEQGFPRLIRSMLPSGVTKVAYDIKLETIAAFECGGNSIFEAN
jgi:hypothetical protein